MHPEVKRGFINLQAAILTALIKEVDVQGVDAYRKLSRLLLNLQRDYEELLDLYKQVENKKPLLASTEQEQLSNMSVKLYQFSRRV